MTDTTVTPIEDIPRYNLCPQCIKRLDELKKMREEIRYMESLVRECASIGASRADAQVGAR